MFKKTLRLAGIASLAAGITLGTAQGAFAAPATSSQVVNYAQGTPPKPPAPKPIPKPAPKPVAPAPSVAPKPVVPTGGRNFQAPKVSANPAAPSGRNFQAPSGTSNKVPAATTGKVTLPKTARASGSSYAVGGQTYTYSSTTYRSYYVTYHGGYPSYGTSLYWQLLNDPYYYPNYGNALSPWYGLAYPSGYAVSNGQFVASSSASAFWTAFWTILIIILIGIVIWYAFRRRSNRPSQDTHHFGDDI